MRIAYNIPSNWPYVYSPVNLSWTSIQLTFSPAPPLVPTGRIVTNSVTCVNSQVIVANISISPEADPALYDVEVTSSKGGKPGIGTESFEVLVEQEALPILSGGSGVAFAVNDESVIVGAVEDKPMVWTIR